MKALIKKGLVATLIGLPMVGVAFAQTRPGASGADAGTKGTTP